MAIQYKHLKTLTRRWLFSINGPHSAAAVIAADADCHP